MGDLIIYIYIIKFWHHSTNRRQRVESSKVYKGSLREAARVTYSAGQVSSHGGVREELQRDLILPLPAVLDVLMAAEAVFTGAETQGSENHTVCLRQLSAITKEYK